MPDTVGRSIDHRAALLTPTEVAKRTGFAIGTIRRWANEGHIAGAVRSPGGRIRIPDSALRTLLAPIKVDGGRDNAA